MEHTRKTLQQGKAAGPKPSEETDDIHSGTYSSNSPEKQEQETSVRTITLKATSQSGQEASRLQNQN